MMKGQEIQIIDSSGHLIHAPRRALPRASDPLFRCKTHQEDGKTPLDHLFGLRDCYCLQVWNTIWYAGEENFGIAQDLLWHILGRNQRWEKGRI